MTMRGRSSNTAAHAKRQVVVIVGNACVREQGPAAAPVHPTIIPVQRRSVQRIGRGKVAGDRMGEVKVD